MNLEKLFNMQKELDNHILERFPNLKNEDLLPKKILALQVELGELAQNWRGFKFWSNDQQPRREKMLEEYVDCLHFILSIGLEQGYDNRTFNLVAIEGLKRVTITDQFNYLFDKIGDFHGIRNHNNYMYIVPLFLGLGEMLGFTEDEIEEGYLAKNKKNHTRQLTGY